MTEHTRTSGSAAFGVQGSVVSNGHPQITDDELLATPLEDLVSHARRIRDRRYGTRVTFSPKVFIPLTMLCQDRCGYCTFAKPPARLTAAYLNPEQVLAIAPAGAEAGRHQAPVTLPSA